MPISKNRKNHQAKVDDWKRRQREKANKYESELMEMQKDLIDKAKEIQSKEGLSKGMKFN